MNPSVSLNNQGIVTKKNIGSYLVRSGERLLPCALSARLYPAARPARGSHSRSRQSPQACRPEQTDPVAVGDQVRFIEGSDGTGLIVEVLPRRNKLSRPSPVPMPSSRPFEQVIVANLDQVVPVFAAAHPEPRWNMLDRYLVSAEAAGLPALVCLTKLDLALDAGGSLETGLDTVVQEYRRIGYPVVLVSAHTGQGLDEVRTALQGSTSVLLGKSGVGKTSLLNALQPGLGLRVSAVSQATGKGRHTTTHLEMFPLAGGGSIVDTPGVREFGLWDVRQEDLAHFFPEMRPYLGRCKFGLDCHHADEPGCVLRRAVTAGEISPRRFYSYLRLRLEAE